jgi:hypothetical protein
MTHTPQKEEQEEHQKRKESRFENFFFDALYNVITYIPVMVISWVVSTLDLD